MDEKILYMNQFFSLSKVRKDGSEYLNEYLLTRRLSEKYNNEDIALAIRIVTRIFLEYEYRSKKDNYIFIIDFKEKVYKLYENLKISTIFLISKELFAWKEFSMDFKLDNKIVIYPGNDITIFN